MQSLSVRESEQSYTVTIHIIWSGNITNGEVTTSKCSNAWEPTCTSDSFFLTKPNAHGSAVRSRLICILRLVWTPTKITRMLAHIHIDIRHGRICAVAAFIHPDLHVHPRKVLALLIAASSSLLRCACTKVLVVARPPNRCSLGTVGIHTPPFSTIRVITATPTCHALIAAACHGARLQDVHQLDISSC